MYSSSMILGTSNIHISPALLYSQKPSYCRNFVLPVKFPLQKQKKLNLKFPRNFAERFRFYSSPCALWRKSSSNSKGSGKSKGVGAESDDFVTRVLKENPCQVEPKYLIGDKLYTSKEKAKLDNKVLDYGVDLLKMLNLKEILEKVKGDDSQLATSEDVFLKDILREYKGKLYVPERIFGANLSEEEEFDKNVDELPKMNIEDFRKCLKTDKIKMLIFKEHSGVSYGFGFRNFVVELKEIPGEKSLQRTKWAMRLNEDQARALLEEYSGPRYEVEKQMMSSVGKLPEFPNTVASRISSRLLVELGVFTTVMATATLVVTGFLASAVFAATSLGFVVASSLIWPMVKPFATFSFGIIFGILEQVFENFIDFFSYGGIFSKLYELSTIGGVASSIKMLKPLMLVILTMVFLVRFTLSRRPKNFRQWDIWQGIEFSQSKSQARVDGATGVTFNDVAGIDEAVEELQELVKYLKNPELFDKMGIKPPHGVLLEGPPGCGKTLVAKAIAGEAGVPFYQMAGSEFVEVLVGVGSARIRDLFKRAKVNKPSVIFIDEIDALATRRQGTSQDSIFHLYNAATQERETTLNQLLTELDGFDTGKGVIFLGATNRMDLLDPALLRPGRFDRKIRVRPPNAKGRLDILKVHAQKVKISKTIDLASCAQNLPGWTGAKLAQLLQEAALVAVRKGHKSIVQSDLDDAVDRLTVGPKRFGVDLGHQGQCRRATTEVGTAMTAHLLRHFENAEVEHCDRISINPRGQTLSQVIFHRLQEESYMFERRPQLLHRLQVFLGGRAAEELIFGRDTSRASVSYLADASWLARKILTIWNLEDPMAVHGEPSPWRKKPKFVGPRLDFEGSLYKHYGFIEFPVNLDLEDDVAKRSDKLILEMYSKTLTLLKQHDAALLKTIKVLLDQKEISGEEIDFILNSYPQHTPISLVLEEKDPGSLPFFREKEERDNYELEESLLSA